MSDQSIHALIEEKEVLDELFHNIANEEDAKAYKALAKELDQKFIKKTDNMVRYRLNIDDQKAVAIKHLKKLADYIKSLESQGEQFDDHASDLLDRLKVGSLQGDLYSIKFRKPVKVLHIINEDLIPQEFKWFDSSIDPGKIDKMKIKKAIKVGEIIAGVKLVDGKRSLLYGLKTLRRGKRRIATPINMFSSLGEDEMDEIEVVFEDEPIDPSLVPNIIDDRIRSKQVKAVEKLMGGYYKGKTTQEKDQHILNAFNIKPPTKGVPK